LFASYANNIFESSKPNIIKFFPNPASDMLVFPAGFPDKCDSLEIIDMKGNVVIKAIPFDGRSIDISRLASGLYLVSMNVKGKYFQGKIVKE
jgi:hypothetical protein